MKMEKNLNIKIIGVAGVARAGKDTFGNAAGKRLRVLITIIKFFLLLMKLNGT